MKTAIRSILALTVTGVAVQAASFLSLGDSAELFLTGTVGVRSDDNVLLSNDGDSDVIFQFTPGLDFVYGSNAINKGHIYYREDISRYGDHSDLNTSLSTVGLAHAYNDEKTKFTFDTYFSQIAQNTFDVRANYLVRRDIYHALGNAELSVTQKTSFSVGGAYDNTNYKRTGFDDSKVYSIPVDYYYKITPKIDVGGGVSFRDTNLDTGVDTKDYFYNVSVRGELTPKLSGKIAVGYVTRDYADSRSDDGSFGVNSTVTYAYDEKTSVILGINNDFGNSAAGSSQRNTIYTIGAQTKISNTWTAGGSVSYRAIKYLVTSGRTDDYVEGTVFATYTVSSQFNLSAAYTYRDYSTDLAGYDFRNNVFSLSANIRY